jgi:hypothetical protein
MMNRVVHNHASLAPYLFKTLFLSDRKWYVVWWVVEDEKWAIVERDKTVVR